MRDIVAATKGSLDFDIVVNALQTLYDEQLIGRTTFNTTRQGMFNEMMAAHETDDDWWNHGDDYFDDGWDYDYEGFYGEWPEDPIPDDANLSQNVAEEDPAIKEAQQAERVAESLAAEAARTWSQAQQATAALRRDRGFGQVLGAGAGAGKSQQGCYICGGNHFARECPDRNHPRFNKGFKGTTNGNYMVDYDP